MRWCSLILAMTLVGMVFAVPLKSQSRIQRIVLDPGHGGKDPGAKGKRYLEKDITLSIALQVKKLMGVQYPKIKIILSRNKDEFKELEDRASLAKKKNADLFISIHCNSSVQSLAKGVETYAIGVNSNPENLVVAERENSVIFLEKNYEKRYEGFNPHSAESYILFSLIQQYTIRQSLKLAEKIETEVSGKNLGSRGVKQAGFLVLRRNTVPSILLEVGFISNEKEEKRLGSTPGQNKIAGEIVKGIEKFGGLATSKELGKNKPQ